MSDPIFGLSFNIVDTEARPVVTANMSVIGLVGTAPLADPTTFPLNDPVTFFSNDDDTLALLGETGTLYQAIQAINAQLGEFEVSAQIVVVRVADAGVNTAQTIANLRGDINARTGMFALLDAGAELGVTPRLIAVPGFTSQAINQIGSIGVTARGTAYLTPPVVAFTGGGGTGAAGTAVLSKGLGSAAVGAGGTGYTTAPTVVVAAPDQPGGIQAVAHATVASGAVTAVIIDNPGKGYSTAPAISFTGAGTGATATGTLTGVLDSVTITNAGQGYTSAPAVGFTGGSGTGAAATAVLDIASNAIVASLPSLLDQLFAVAVVDGPATTMTAAIAWRNTISSKRIIPHDPAYKILDDDGDIVVVPASPYILGIAVRRDHEYQGRPFHSWANQPVNSIVGVSRPIGFSLLDGASEGQTLLSHNVGVTVRGESTDGAIADGGYIFIGTDGCSPDSLWQFYSEVRGRDYIHLAFIRSLRGYLGRQNITAHGIQAVINTMESLLLFLQANEDILGFRLSFPTGINSVDQLRLGRFTVQFNAEEAPVLRYLGIRSARYAPALETLLTDLLSQLDLTA